MRCANESRGSPNKQEPPLWPAVSVKSCYVALSSKHQHQSLTSTGALYKKKNPTWSVVRREDGCGLDGNELCVGLNCALRVCQRGREHDRERIEQKKVKEANQRQSPFQNVRAL